VERLRPIVADIDDACREIGRDPESLVRTVDVYTVVPPGTDHEVPDMDQPVRGGVDEVVAHFAALSELGVSEVRVDLASNEVEAIEAMAPVVEAVHAL
jgi:hypothetical protein